MNLFFEILFPECKIESINLKNETITIRASRKVKTAVCPECRQPSGRVHSYYSRKPQDLPMLGLFVRLNLRVRRFRCQNQACSKQTFAERWGNWLKPYAQKTTRNKKAHYHIGQVAGGEGGCRLLSHLKMEASGTTLIRIIHSQPPKDVETPRIIGVDDWAIKRGRTRDRSPEYAKGIQNGAPNAKQVADRWHLLLNLYQMLEKYIRQSHKRLCQLPITTYPDQDSITERRGSFIRTKQAMIDSKKSRSRRMALHQDIQSRKQAGETILSISQTLSLHRETVRTFYYAEEFPERSQSGTKPSILDQYIPYLEARWTEGCEDARALWREIQSLDYSGGYGLVNKWLRPRRRKPSPYSTKKALHSSHWSQEIHQSTQKFPSAKKIARILLQPEGNLSDEESEFIRELHQDSAIAKLYPLIQNYQLMIHKRDSSLLDSWLEECVESDIPRLRTFAEGIQKDYSAVRNALDFHWSNGPPEGHINRLKLVKRQMFGRAKLDLLKRKIVYISQEH